MKNECKEGQLQTLIGDVVKLLRDSEYHESQKRAIKMILTRLEEIYKNR